MRSWQKLAPDCRTPGRYSASAPSTAILSTLFGKQAQNRLIVFESPIQRATESVVWAPKSSYHPAASSNNPSFGSLISLHKSHSSGFDEHDDSGAGAFGSAQLAEPKHMPLRKDLVKKMKNLRAESGDDGEGAELADLHSSMTTYDDESS